jgi:hypothetical protein
MQPLACEANAEDIGGQQSFITVTGDGGAAWRASRPPSPQPSPIEKWEREKELCVCKPADIGAILKISKSQTGNSV